MSLIKIGFVIDNTSIFKFEDLVNLNVASVFKLQALTDDEKSFEDFANVNEFYKYLIDNKQFGKTSTASLGSIKSAIDAGLAKYDKVIVLPTNSKISSTYANACICAKDYDSTKVQVVDTKSVVGATRYLVEKGNELIAQNFDFEQIVEQLTSFASKMQTYIIISNFDALVKNGRIGKAKSQIATLLNIKAIVGVNGDGVEIISKQRSNKKAIKFFIDMFEKTLDPKYKVYLGHIFNEKEFNEFDEAFKKNSIKSSHIDIPPIIGLHGGKFLIGITFVKK